MKILLLLSILFLFFSDQHFFVVVRAQGKGKNNNQNKNHDPLYTAVTIIVFSIIFIVFYLLFYYFLNNFFRATFLGRGARPAQSQPRTGGLDEALVQSFPTFAYAEVAAHNKGPPMECAVCLSAFEGHETLRLLPTCDHVFHRECVDPWLEAHTTCPFCRANLVPQLGELTPEEDEEGPSQVDELVVEVNGVQDDVVGVSDLEEGVMVGKGGMIWRWNSTGHVARIDRVMWLESGDRFTLRLPEKVRRDFVTGKLRRTRSCITI